MNGIPHSQLTPKIVEQTQVTIVGMEKAQYSKLISEIPEPNIAISMGCNVGCPFIGRTFDDNWRLEDPTGKSDEEFKRIIREIENKILQLRNELRLR